MRQLLATALRRLAVRLDPPTRFAGRGNVINIYDVSSTSVTSIGDAVEWAARTQLGGQA